MSGVRKVKGRGMRDATERVRKLGVIAGQRVARTAAPKLSAAALSDFSGGRTAYGDARPTGVNGPLSLVRTGATRATLGFSAQGTVMRAVLSTRWARYLVGRYRILPVGDRTAMPSKWSALIGGVVKAALDAEWGGA